MRSVFLEGVIPFVQAHPEWLPEILVVNLGNLVGADWVLYTLAPDLYGSPELVNRIEQMARALPDPYHRARALLRLSRALAGQRTALLTEAVEHARSIDEPHRRERVLEYLLPELNGPLQAELLDDALSAARAIGDPDDRMRALARLSRYLPADRRADALREALMQVESVHAEDERAEALSVLRPLLAADRLLLAESRRLARAISDPLNRSKALGLRGPQLLALQETLRSATAGETDLWTPLTLGVLFDDLLNYFASGPSSAETDLLWTELPGSPQATADKLAERGIEKGLTLTRPAAVAVNAMLDGGHEELVHRLLPLLHSPRSDAVPIVDAWLDHWDETIAQHAALFLAEPVRRLTPRTVHGLLTLINDREDRSRLRASLVLHGPIVTLLRPRRHFRASELGRDVIDALGQAKEERDRDAPGAALAIVRAYRDILHDDPRLIEEAAKMLAAEGKRAPEAEHLLRRITEMTPEAWEAFQRAFESGNETVQAALTFALCYLCVKEHDQLRIEDPGPWLKSLAPRGLEQVRSIRGEPCPVIAACQEALRLEREGQTTDLVELAEQALERYVITAADALEAEAGAIASALAALTDCTAYDFPTGNRFSAFKDKTAVMVTDEPELFGLLVRWLARTLAADARDDGLYYKCGFLLTDVAIYAERSPATFANLCARTTSSPYSSEL